MMVGAILILSIGFIIYVIIDFIIEIKKINLERERRKKVFEKYYFRFMAEEIKRKAQANKYSKWYQLDGSTKDKILKIKALVDRGEEGEKVAAKAKYQHILKKNGISAKDVPV